VRVGKVLFFAPWPDNALPLDMDARNAHAVSRSYFKELIATRRLEIGWADVAVRQLGEGKSDILDLSECVLPYTGVRVVESGPFLVD
jgi:hypothetical protein